MSYATHPWLWSFYLAMNVLSAAALILIIVLYIQRRNQEIDWAAHWRLPVMLAVYGALRWGSLLGWPPEYIAGPVAFVISISAFMLAIRMFRTTGTEAG